MSVPTNKEQILLERLNRARLTHLSNPISFEKAQVAFEALPRKASDMTGAQKKIAFFLRDFLKVLDRAQLWTATDGSTRGADRDSEELHDIAMQFLADMGPTWVQAAETAVPAKLPDDITSVVAVQLSGGDDAIARKIDILSFFSALVIPAINYFENIDRLHSSRIAELALINPDFSRSLRSQLGVWERQQTPAFKAAGPGLGDRVDQYWDVLTSDPTNKISKAIRTRGLETGIPSTGGDQETEAEAAERMYHLSRILVAVDREFDLGNTAQATSSNPPKPNTKGKGKGKGKKKGDASKPDVNDPEKWTTTAAAFPDENEDETGPEIALVPGLAYPHRDSPTSIGVGILLDTGSSRSYVERDVAKAAGFRTTGRTRSLPITTAFGDRRRVKAVEVVGSFRLVSEDGTATRLLTLRLWSVTRLAAEVIIGFRDLAKLGLHPAGKGVKVEGVHTDVYLPYSTRNGNHPDAPEKEGDGETTAAIPGAETNPGSPKPREPTLNGGPVQSDELHFGEDVTPAQRRRFLDFVNADLAVWRGTTPMRHTELLEVHLELKPGAKSSFRPTYTTSRTTMERLKQEVLKQEKQGVVERTKGPGLYASPVFLILKDDGSYRALFDARNINRLTRPPPKAKGTTMVRVAQSVGRHKYWAVLDIASAFFSIKVAEDSQHLLQFMLPDKSTWKMARMPMGLSQSPSLWQQALAMALGADLMAEVAAYMDDLAAGAETIDELLDLIERLVRALSKAGFTLSIKKSRIGFKRVRFVGLELSEDGVSLPRDRKDAIKNMQAPKNKDELKTFLGVAGFYEPATRGIAAAKAALLELTLDVHRFRWGDAEQAAFDHIVRTITEQAFVDYPDWDNARFTVATDASKVAIGAVLGQLTGQRHKEGPFEDMAVERPVASASHKLAGAECKWTTFHKELYCVYWALSKFHWAIHGRTVDVYCDNEAVVRLVQAKENEDRVCLDLDLRLNEYERRWLYEISTYDIRMHHRPGKKNVVADYLSRRPGDEPGHLADDMAGRDAEWNETTVQMRDARLEAKKTKQPRRPTQHDKTPPTENQIRAEARDALAYEAAVWGDQDVAGVVAMATEEDPPRRRQTLETTLGVDAATARAIREAMGTGRARDWAGELQNQDEILRELEQEAAGKPPTQPSRPEERDVDDDNGGTPLEHVATEGIPAEELQAMYNLHDLYGHCGSKQLAALAEKDSGVQRVGQPEQWTSRIRTAKVVAQGCRACLERKPGATRPVPGPALAADATRVDHTWHMDLAGPFKLEDGTYHLLVVKDALSKHITVRPLLSTAAADTRVAIRSLMAERGVPQKIHADRAGNFASEEAKTWLHSLGIQTSFSAAGNPRANGGAERAVRTVKEILRLMGYELDPAKTPFGLWMERLYQGLWAYNNRPSDATGKTPNEVLYARNAEGNPDPTARTDVEGAAEDRRRRRATAERADVARFQKGDEVWRKLPSPKGGALNKTFFQGPYRIVSVLRKEGGTINTYRIQKIGSRARHVVNGRDLKLGHSVELDQRLAELETATSASGESNSDNPQFVLGILRARGRAEEREYLVQFGPDETAWLPAAQVSPAAIQEYARKAGTVAIPRTE